MGPFCQSKQVAQSRFEPMSVWHQNYTSLPLDQIPVQRKRKQPILNSRVSSPAELTPGTDTAQGTDENRNVLCCFW